MQTFRGSAAASRLILGLLVLAPVAVLAAALTGGVQGDERDETLEQVLRGRQRVISGACGDCHGGIANPAAEAWLAGNSDDGNLIGEYRVWARNLTPDDETGLGRVSERQIFNALRYGLRPGKTPDVEITSVTPGEGNHPANPHYLSPGMPWVFIRCLSDQELWDIAAYLKRGLRPESHRVAESEAPPDAWASVFAPERLPSCESPPFPTIHEQEAVPEEKRAQVLRGRAAARQCGVCHGGGNPATDGWLAGLRSGVDAPSFTFVQEFEIGPFRTRPRNLTPDNTTGLGRFSERQIFNALRFGLRPGETPDAEITSSTPGEGNHPQLPKYLAPPMPWPVFRHRPDQELWDIAAYLKHGVKPVTNRVEDSEGPPDFWGSFYTPQTIGTYPAPPFPTARERRP